MRVARDPADVRGWHSGLGRYRGDEFRWYRVSGLRGGPNVVLDRTALEIVERRDPAAGEMHPTSAAVLTCRTPDGSWEIAMEPDAVTGFSTAPLRFASHAGLALTGVSLLLFVYIAIGWLSGSAVQGWTSTMLVTVFLGAVQMFVLGMIGEYLGRLYVESKRRPLYIVADIAGPIQGKATLGFRAEPTETPLT